MSVSVFGAGSWGTALAAVLAGNGVPTVLWARRADAAERISREHCNAAYLPGVELPAELEVTAEIARAAEASEWVLAVPTGSVRGVLADAVACCAPGSAICAAKGYEPDSRKRMSEVLAEELPGSAGVAVLAGPSHAEEVGRGIPTTVVVASLRADTQTTFQQLFHSQAFRVYTNGDLVGVETAASLKNVIAIAAGICDGLGFGDNTKGALLTRGLAEMSRLGAALGAEEATFFGLAGIGDLVTTCMSRHSRNRHLGELVGKGAGVEDAAREIGMVSEGVGTTRSAVEIAVNAGVELPITKAVSEILFAGKDPRAALDELMSRDPRAEAG
ncbi:MAG: NAD(P)H-dependent glycerol-3-phosphate dehydrogenase [Gemmatimonadota bacterium]|jgi:glycerol-3-phosphate dehydrogenase (NAD(P)+)|nr:glycerol-3-phosphate dehydrogenase [Gemmatimonadota bacterium]MDP6528492.1 NAD(P)H-dependent glycerol-3-phosphate dehydrogenase [Gemmatimonadota bacterium]MDP6801853.1 NAD(P)H-dependent glycerol-3-phosphate dehydrogenase [Gemmatimonadota bacterium]MDP7031579.1 NAD(P)H-dependent glycerol-3-phosphate dehydrogenase [Gemmatimonadota bacterium]